MVCVRIVENAMDFADNSDRKTDRAAHRAVDLDNRAFDSLSHRDALHQLDAMDFVWNVHI